MRRVVITGIGLVTPLGNNLEDSWSALLAGKSGAGPITRFDASQFATRFACEVKGWDSSPFLDKREAKHLDRFLHFAIGAGLMAMEDAGYADRKVPAGEEERWGVYIGAGLGGVETLEKTHLGWREKGPRHGFSPYFVVDIIINMAPGLLSMKTGAQGPNMSHVSACSTGAHSIGEASRAIRWGDADVMLAGGAESTISVLGVGGFNASRAMSTRNDDPAHASRPFDRDRDGFVMGEGAAVLVLEERDRAIARGAPIYAEVLGYGTTNDGHHMTAPRPDGAQAARCMRQALADAELAPHEIGYVNAHGSSTPLNDPTETMAIRQVLGDHAYRIPVSGTKGYYGHALGASGAFEAAICALGLEREWLPPTINHDAPGDDCDLDYVPGTGRDARVDAILSNSFGFGGINASLVFGRAG